MNAMDRQLSRLQVGVVTCREPTASVCPCHYWAWSHRGSDLRTSLPYRNKL
jgi:hypothetical protein